MVKTETLEYNKTLIWLIKVHRGEGTLYIRISCKFLLSLAQHCLGTHTNKLKHWYWSCNCSLMPDFQAISIILFIIFFLDNWF